MLKLINVASAFLVVTTDRNVSLRVKTRNLQQLPSEKTSIALLIKPAKPFCMLPGNFYQFGLMCVLYASLGELTAKFLFFPDLEVVIEPHG